MEFLFLKERCDFMTKILVIPPNNNIDSLIDIDIYGFILGIKNVSVFNSCQYDINNLKTTIKKIKDHNKKIFVAINKIIYNEDIPLIKEYLLILDKLDIEGVIFDDISIFNLWKKLNLSFDLIWYQNHLLTNYYTCNYWYKKGIKYGFISTEITLKEIMEIKQNTNMKLLFQGYGYLPVMQSSRKLLTNYFEYIKFKKNKRNYKIYEKISQRSYPIYEDQNGTYILSDKVLNSIEETPILVKNNIDYIVLSGLNINNNRFKKVCYNFIEALDNYEDDKIIKQISKKMDNNDYCKGFLYKETIYKVKRNE